MPESRVTIFDGNNYLRRKYEETRTTSALRDVVMDIRTELARRGNRCIFVRDGYRGNDYRKKIFPGYKSNRTKESVPDGFYDQMKVFDELLKHLPIISIQVPEYEADDIVADLVLTFKESYPDATFHIKSTDKDFHQLGVSYEGKPLPFGPEETILYKVLVGDTSDAIPGVLGFGVKKYEKLNKETALQWLEDGFPLDRVPLEFHQTQKDWIETNRDLLIAMRDVCKFRPVPDGLLDKHAVFGDNNPQEVERILKENLA